MIIDFHTHVFPDSIAKRAVDGLIASSGGLFPPYSDGTVDGLIKNMDDWGIDISVNHPVLTKPTSLESTNRWAKNIESERIISFAGFHPHTDDFKRDIDFIVSLGFKGIKMHPEFQNFNVDDGFMLPIYDYALSKGLILLLHSGFDPSYKPPYRSTPKMFANIIKQLQGGTIVAAHLGGQRLCDEVEEHLCGKNVYFDTCMGFEYYSQEQFTRIVRAHGADKILFASDSPWSCAKNEINAINNTPLTQEEKDLIFYKNAKRLLGI